MNWLGEAHATTVADCLWQNTGHSCLSSLKHEKLMEKGKELQWSERDVSD